MKRFMFSVALFLMVATAVFAQDINSSNSVKIAHFSANQTIVMDVPFGVIASYFLASTGIDTNIVYIDYLNLERYTEDNGELGCYLVLKGNNKIDSTYYAFAMELEVKDGDISMLAPNVGSSKTTHTCSGNCGSCSYTRDTKDKITGCQCNYPKGYCNHTITTTESSMVDFIGYTLNCAKFCNLLMNYNGN